MSTEGGQRSGKTIASMAAMQGITTDEVYARLAEQAHDDANAEEVYAAEQADTALTARELGQQAVDCKERIEANQFALYIIEKEIRKRIEAAAATTLPDDEFEMTLEPGRIVNWETNHLIPLKEILTTDDLKTIFTEEHDEEVPEQVIPAHTVHHNDAWASGVKLNAMARKYGEQAQAHVAHAGIRSDPKVTVARKERVSA